MQKINVIGTSGSGKSTFAKRLSDKLQIPYIEMDAIFWGKDWAMPSDEVFFENVKAALDKKSCWVLDGNYSRTTPIKWKDADTVIWIDFSFGRTLYQAVKRAFLRTMSQEELWPGTGNRESFKKLFSKDSIVLWTIKTYWQNKVRYSKIKHNPDYNHITFVRLRNPKECKRFLG